MENCGVPYEDFAKCFTTGDDAMPKATAASILVQLYFITYSLIAKYGKDHCDLHLGNLTIRLTSTPVKMKFTMASEALRGENVEYSFITNIVVTLIDFGNAESVPPNSNPASQSQSHSSSSQSSQRSNTSTRKHAVNVRSNVNIEVLLGKFAAVGSLLSAKTKSASASSFALLLEKDIRTALNPQIVPPQLKTIDQATFFSSGIHIFREDDWQISPMSPPVPMSPPLPLICRDHYYTKNHLERKNKNGRVPIYPVLGPYLKDSQRSGRSRIARTPVNQDVKDIDGKSFLTYIPVSRNYSRYNTDKIGVYLNREIPKATSILTVSGHLDIGVTLGRSNRWEHEVNPKKFLSRSFITTKGSINPSGQAVSFQAPALDVQLARNAEDANVAFVIVKSPTLNNQRPEIELIALREIKRNEELIALQPSTGTGSLGGGIYVYDEFPEEKRGQKRALESDISENVDDYGHPSPSKMANIIAYIDLTID